MNFSVQKLGNSFMTLFWTMGFIVIFLCYVVIIFYASAPLPGGKESIKETVKQEVHRGAQDKKEHQHQQDLNSFVDISATGIEDDTQDTPKKLKKKSTTIGVAG